MNNLAHPLYITAVCGQSDQIMLGGIFQMQDRVGFPLDASYEECKQRGYLIDWLEALCDCWLNDCLKFDSFVRQASSITGENLETRFSEAGAVVLAKFPKMRHTTNPVNTACRYILSRKRLYGKAY